MIGEGGREAERRDLASSRLTNCKYLDCGCRMTLINIADGTECRRRDEEARSRENGAREREGDSVGGYGGNLREGGERERPLRVFIISPSRLDSVKL